MERWWTPSTAVFTFVDGLQLNHRVILVRAFLHLRRRGDCNTSQEYATSAWDDSSLHRLFDMICIERMHQNAWQANYGRDTREIRGVWFENHLNVKKVSHPVTPCNLCKLWRGHRSERDTTRYPSKYTGTSTCRDFRKRATRNFRSQQLPTTAILLAESNSRGVYTRTLQQLRYLSIRDRL